MIRFICTNVRIVGTKTFRLAAILAVIPAAAMAQQADRSADLRSFANPPLLLPEGREEGDLEQLAPALLPGGVPLPDPRETIAYRFKIAMVPGRIYDPWRLRDDEVLLRAYQGDEIDPAVPFMAPTITMRPGQTVRVTIDNQLETEPGCDAGATNTPHCFNTTNLHSHGLWVSPTGNSDNVLLSIPPQTEFTYEYNVSEDHPAGTFWYHPHRHGSTAIQVSSGMAGALVIHGDRRPTADRPGDVDILLRNPDGSAMAERVLLFQQAQYACYGQDGNIQSRTEPSGATLWYCNDGQQGIIKDYTQFGPGTQWVNSGRYTMINGRVQPRIEGARTGRFERWRMIHAGVRESVNFALYRLDPDTPDFHSVPAEEQQDWMRDHCRDRVPALQIAADGLTSSQIRRVHQARLQPGYRVDLLTWFDRPGLYCLIDDASAQGLLGGAEDRQLLGVVAVDGAAQGPGMEATLQGAMVAAAEAAMPGPDPDGVRAAVIADLRNGLRLDRFVWHPTVADDEITGHQVVEFNIQTAPFLEFQVNGRPYDPARIDRELPLGGVEEWTLTSRFVNHPFHIHVNPFQVVSVLNAQGQDVTAPGPALDPDYAGMIGQWKDTLFVKQDYQIRVRTRYQRYIGEFVLHCHILDHEDQGMMENIRIGIPAPSGGVVAHGHH